VLGQDETTRVAMEERNVQILLKGTDAAADGGLVEVELFTGPGKAARLSHLIEQFDLVPIQGDPSR
jgi:hypothetical protein